MKIIIKPRYLEGCSSWESKIEGVVLVEKESDIEPLWKLLCEQDEYWVGYKNLIKVAPKEIDGVSEIISMCEYVGKTDIYELEELQKQIPFIIYQYRDNEDY